MKATSVDSLSDTVATTLVLIATLISKYTGLLLDGWFGILVGLLYSLYRRLYAEGNHRSSSRSAAEAGVYR